MKRVISSLLFFCAVGCGGNQPAGPTAENQQIAPAVAVGPPSKDEAISSIREFFAESGAGFSNIEVNSLSNPVEVPKDAVRGWGDVWVFSLTMNCKNVVGFPQQNKNWLILMGREKGKATVKDYYHNLERVQQSPLGKDWFAQKGFGEPSIIDE